jgi:uncharacterized membrane protein YeaQ/YmgE (transglycosylase-associated protein family)
VLVVGLVGAFRAQLASKRSESRSTPPTTHTHTHTQTHSMVVDVPGAAVALAISYGNWVIDVVLSADVKSSVLLRSYGSGNLTGRGA